MSGETSIQSHSYQHFQDLQLSSTEFYSMVETTVKEMKYPNLMIARVKLSEGGFFSPNREYLQIRNNFYQYYVCAAPYGKSFFISWWLKENENWLINLLARIPLLGWLVPKKRNKTFYQIDSELIFSKGIHTIVSQAVEKLTLDKGYTVRETALA
jgi:hypothetical protein